MVATVRDRNALITGAASGIGRALAWRFGREGATLGLVDRDAGALSALVAELTEEGIRVQPLPCDVTSESACRDAVQRFLDAHGGLDILVNNAGITHLGRFAETNPAVIRTVVEVNLFGALHCTNAALPSLLERRGTIVVLSSVAGFAPLAGRSGYAASKHALHGLFESLRAEHASDGLRVLMVCPSFTRTNIGRNALGGDGRPHAGTRTVTGNELEPDDVAEAIYRAVLGGKRLLLVSPTAKLSYWLSRFAPALYERIMTRRLFAG